MDIPFTAPAYDAFVTALEDRGDAPVGCDIEVVLPLFEVLESSLDGAIPQLDLLGVEGHNWESLRLRADAAA